MSSYGKPGFTAEEDQQPGEFGTFGITLEDNRDEPRDEYSDDYGAEWDLNLPHQCSEWSIAAGGKEHVLAVARRFRAELDAAIAKLEGTSVQAQADDLEQAAWQELRRRRSAR